MNYTLYSGSVLDVSRSSFYSAGGTRHWLGGADNRTHWDGGYESNKGDAVVMAEGVCKRHGESVRVDTTREHSFAIVPKVRNNWYAPGVFKRHTDITVKDILVKILLGYLNPNSAIAVRGSQQDTHHARGGERLFVSKYHVPKPRWKGEKHDYHNLRFEQWNDIRWSGKLIVLPQVGNSFGKTGVTIHIGVNDSQPDSRDVEQFYYGDWYSYYQALKEATSRYLLSNSCELLLEILRKYLIDDAGNRYVYLCPGEDLCQEPSYMSFNLGQKNLYNRYR